MNLYDILELSKHELSQKTDKELVSIYSVVRSEYNDLMDDYAQCNLGPDWYNANIHPLWNQLTAIESALQNNVSTRLPVMLVEFLDSEYGGSWEFVGIDDEWASIKANSMLLEYNITHFE